MKTLKRISALLLVLMLMASFSITAFAEIVTVTGGGGEGGSSTQLGILEGEAQISYTDSNGGQHSLDVPGGNKPTIIDEGGGHETPVTPDFPDIGKEDIKDFIQQQINNNDPVIQHSGNNNENSGSGTVENGYNNGSVPEGSSTAPDTVGKVIVNENTNVKFVEVDGVRIGQDDHQNVKWERNGSTTTVDIMADIETTKSTGLSVTDYSTGQAVNISVGDPNSPGSGGNITVNNPFATGISIAVESQGSVTVTTAGDITADYQGVCVDAGEYSPEVSTGTVNVKTGSITAGTMGIDATARYGSNVSVSADNVNVHDGGTGISIRTYNNADNTADNKVTITVGTEDYYADDGIVKGGVNLEDVNNGTVSITAWKIDGALTGNACDSAINYIIRIAEESKGMIAAQNEGGTAIKTEQAGNTVYVTSSTGEAYNNGEKLTAEADGRFSFTVAPGGGILLSAIKKLDPPKPDPKPQPSSPMFVTTYKLKFDLGGGVMPDGKTELELKCSAGQKITLPEAPTREGFTFAGWQTTVRGKTVILDAGAKFTVTAAKTFVALWEEA